MARLIEVIKRIMKLDDAKIIADSLENLLNRLGNKREGDYSIRLLNKAEAYIEKLKRRSYDKNKLDVFETRYHQIKVGWGV